MMLGTKLGDVSGLQKKKKEELEMQHRVYVIGLE